MSVLQIVFLSIIQGVTEWLPISSSGHLVLFENWFQIGASLEFDIFLHLATLVIILWFFRKEVRQVVEAPLLKKDSDKKNWWIYIIVSSVCTAILGYIFYRDIDIFRSVDSVSGWLIVTSMLLLATKFSKGQKNIGIWHAVALGVAQGFAVLPGLSRSGAVIALALAMKIKKQQAFEYGFLVAVPAIIGSFLLTFQTFIFHWTYLIGFVVAVIVSYITLILLKLLLKRDYFYLFFIYTLVLAMIIKLA